MKRAAAALLLIAFCACSKGSDPEKIAKTARSWRATLRVVSASAVAPTYKKQVAEVAESELSKLPASNADVKAALDDARKLK